MKLLFILEDNFPESGACTSLLNKMLFEGGLADKCNSITVLAAKDRYTQLKNFQHKGVTVHNAVVMSRVSVTQYKKLVFKHPLLILKAIFDKITLKLTSGVVNKANSRFIKQKIEEINSENYDAVIAVMGYFDVAAAAMNFKKENPGISFVLYQVDPCSSNESFPNSTRAERVAFEKELYATADRIITTPILLEEAQKVYSDEIIGKMIPIEFPNVVPVDTTECSDNERIKCVFTGNIYGDFRDPSYTLKLFDDAEKRFSFEIIGSVKAEVKEEFVNHRVIYHGSKSLDETREQIMAADILVNIGNRMLNQVPSKLFEYISYGKPIVNICKNRNCPTLPYLEKYKYVLNLYEEDDIFDEQVKMLNSFILGNYKNRMTSDEILKEFEACTPQYCAVQMIKVFENLTDK